MNYKLFTNDGQLPVDRKLVVVKIVDEKSGNILIGDYNNGSYCGEPNYFAVANKDCPITNFFNENDEIFVEEKAEFLFIHAVQCAKGKNLYKCNHESNSSDEEYIDWDDIMEEMAMFSEIDPL